MFSNASCAGMPTETFFRPDDVTTVEWRAHVQIVKKMCEDCPAQAECLEHALRHEGDGIWGGTTETEREVMRQNLHIWLEPIQAKYVQTTYGRPVPECGTERGYQHHYWAVRKYGGVVTCEKCRTAHRNFNRVEWKKLPKRERILAPCGTPAAYNRHHKNGEKPCQACKNAHAREKRERKATAQALAVVASVMSKGGSND